ncbi:hypothetical protein RhiirA5_499045 [Rhizophagus irregularis]|uniref:Uncharacterized protein n=1 Tax=Rhizophagus irregularis TaxID=588596 RepID=A0A2I1FFE3_9GLOM|nr:hypothetical protein RhiirA5_499045 [Rhizophagus irregularis]PKY33100.1 hypothetical protein RhiirB3_532325 [Rhizophagus irregularis]GET66833.1 hypothetical protein GLOIN_2v1867267 [Rhizophagus irregularis DAOM 181602=DAOM 197198]
MLALKLGALSLEWCWSGGLDDCDESILSNKDEHVLLYSGKKFQLCEGCKVFIDALRSNSNSEQLIELLQEFTEVGKSDSEELNEINQEDEINDKLILTLWYQMSRKSEKKCDKR